MRSIESGLRVYIFVAFKNKESENLKTCKECCMMKIEESRITKIHFVNVSNIVCLIKWNEFSFPHCIS